MLEKLKKQKLSDCQISFQKMFASYRLKYSKAQQNTVNPHILRRVCEENHCIRNSDLTVQTSLICGAFYGNHLIRFMETAL